MGLCLAGRRLMTAVLFYQQVVEVPAFGSVRAVSLPALFTYHTVFCFLLFCKCTVILTAFSAMDCLMRLLYTVNSTQVDLLAADAGALQCMLCRETSVVCTATWHQDAFRMFFYFFRTVLAIIFFAVYTVHAMYFSFVFLKRTVCLAAGLTNGRRMLCDLCRFITCIDGNAADTGMKAFVLIGSAERTNGVAVIARRLHMRLFGCLAVTAVCFQALLTCHMMYGVQDISERAVFLTAFAADCNGMLPDLCLYVTGIDRLAADAGADQRMLIGTAGRGVVLEGAVMGDRCLMVSNGIGRPAAVGAAAVFAGCFVDRSGLFIRDAVRFPAAGALDCLRSGFGL